MTATHQIAERYLATGYATGYAGGRRSSDDKLGTMSVYYYPAAAAKTSTVCAPSFFLDPVGLAAPTLVPACETPHVCGDVKRPPLISIARPFHAIERYGGGAAGGTRGVGEANSEANEASAQAADAAHGPQSPAKRVRLDDSAAATTAVSAAVPDAPA